MYREIIKNLLKWKDDFEKPLMLIGARQTGKTYILKEFCDKYYDNYVYINLEKEKEITKVFDETLDPEQIIESISIIMNIKIDIEKTIIFLDEIQVNENAITSLKYFCESSKPYKIVCTGSLLGVKINRFKSSFPVGKVQIEYLYPMSFLEFLIASDEQNLIKMIRDCYHNNKAMIEPLHNKALDLYRKYLVIGGMPEVVKSYLETKNLSMTNFQIQDMTITSYLADMNKYTDNTEGIKNSKIYNSIPRQLAREKNTFKYSIVDESARKIRYESSLDWLIASNMIMKCNLVDKNESPLKAFINEEKFKIYLNDSGLLRALSNIDYREIILEKNEMFNGVLTENYVANELYLLDKEIYYYNFANYEIDFLIKAEGDIIPVEVKTGKRTTSKSLNEYIKKYNPKYSVRISSKNFGYENGIKSVPLYAVFCLEDR